MAVKYLNKRTKKNRRHKRIRKKIIGTAECPRFCVSFSLQHIYLQIINDDQGSTLTSSSTMDKEFTEQGKKPNLEGAALLGQIVAEKAKKAGIEKVIFDRCGYKYHGRMKAIAEAARKSGLIF